MIIDDSDGSHAAKLRMKLFEKEHAVEKQVLADIRKRQAGIAGLRRDELGYTAVWGDGELTPGCRDCCLKGRWTQIRTTTKCNLSCPFCYYFETKKDNLEEWVPEDSYFMGSHWRYFAEDDIRALIEIQGRKWINGVGWLYHEPLIDVDKIIPLMKFIRERGFYQWMYTNGLLATEGNLRKLAAAGLDEIRFNLAATNCSDRVIKNMGAARKHFKYLCIESPMFTKYYNSFMKKRRAILDTGVDHIHFAELQLLDKTISNFKSEGPIYRHRQGYVSPIRSRQLVYDVFECAAEEKWQNVVLHDCSNEVKFYRGIISGADMDFGVVLYGPSQMSENIFHAHLK